MTGPWFCTECHGTYPELEVWRENLREFRRQRVKQSILGVIDRMYDGDSAVPGVAGFLYGYMESMVESDDDAFIAASVRGIVDALSEIRQRRGLTTRGNRHE